MVTISAMADDLAPRLAWKSTGRLSAGGLINGEYWGIRTSAKDQRHFLESNHEA